MQQSHEGSEAVTELPDEIVVYGTPTCPQVGPVRALLGQTDAPFVYVNIAADRQARERVREINAGADSVPTLAFPDGTSLTEPSAGELRRKLESLGYHVPLRARLAGNAWNLLLIAGVILALLRAFGVF